MSSSETTIRRLAAQHAATRALAEAEDVPEALERIAREVAEALDWEVGSVWQADARGELRAVALHVRRGVDAFAQATRELRLQPGAGLPGRVWRSGEPTWIEDVARDPDFRRSEAATRSGLRSAFAFPVRVGDQVLAVFEFLSRSAGAPDRLLLETMAAIGQQIGLFVRRREAEQRLRDQEERARLISETSPDVIAVIDAHSIIRSVNPAVERVFGWRAEELVGRPLTLLMPPEMALRHEEALQRYLRTGERGIDWSGVQLPGVHRDGHLLTLEISFGTFRSEGERLFAGIMRDVSERLRQQQRLEESTAELEAAIDELEEQRAAAEAARAAAEQAREEAVEAARWSRFLAEAGRALGASLDREEALRTLAHLAVPAIADFCIVDLLQEDGSVRRVEMVHGEEMEPDRMRDYERRFPPGARPSSGSPQVMRTGEPFLLTSVTDADLRQLARGEEHLRWLREVGMSSLMVVPLVARGRTLGAITLVTARSARHYNASDLGTVEALAGRAALALDNAALYEQAIAADRAKGNFLAIMSHELRTPLTAIMGYTDILGEGIAGELQPRQREYLERVMVSARHLLQIIDEILTFSRLEVGRERTRLQAVDVAEFAEKTAALVKPALREKQLGFELSLPQEQLVLETDPDKLRQVLLDILFNAVKFTQQGRVRLAVREEETSVVFEVEDTGIGIGAENLAHIFEPFWQAEDAMTRREGGTGMGLSVARRLTLLLRGDIQVRSTPGVGTVFSVRLPRRRPSADSAAA